MSAELSSLQPGDVVGIIGVRQKQDIVIKAAPVDRVTPKRIAAGGYTFERETGRSAGIDKHYRYTLTTDRAVIDAHLAELADRQAVREAEAQKRAELEATPRWRAAATISNAIMPFSTQEIHDRYTESQLVRIAEILNEPNQTAP